MGAVLRGLHFSCQESMLQSLRGKKPRVKVQDRFLASLKARDRYLQSPSACS